MPTVADEPPAIKDRPDVVRADVDVSELSEPTVRFIRTVGEVYGSKNFSEALKRLSAVGNEFTDDQIKAVMEELIHKRNDKALAALDKRLADYNTVFIPWGGQHMPDFEAALKDRGFRIESQRMLPLARYQTILNALVGQTGRQAFRQAPGFSPAAELTRQAALAW
jgi:hypothetical protein